MNIPKNFGIEKVEDRRQKTEVGSQESEVVRRLILEFGNLSG